MRKNLMISLFASIFVLFSFINIVYASLSIASVSIPTSANQGASFSISASISGSSVSDVSATLDLPTGISCTPSGSQSVSLSSSGTGTGSWTCSGSTAGDYTNRITVSVSGTDSSSSSSGGSVSASDQTGLKILSPASLTASSTGKSGGSVIFTVGVNNAGGLDTTYTVDVSCSSGATCTGTPSGSQSISGNSVKTHDIRLVGTAGTTYTATATITGANGQVLTTSQALTEPTVTTTTTTTTTPAASGLNQTTPGVKLTLQKGKATITIPSIAAAKSAVVVINKTEDIAFRQISVFVKNSVNNIQVTVTKLADKPAAVTQEVTGKVYHYVQVDKVNATDADINQSAIRFEVEKSWLTTNNVNKSNVALYRYETNAWSKLQTTMMSEDDTTVLYEAISPGLSVFAISGELVGAAPSEQPSQPTPEAQKEQAKPVSKGKGWVVILVVIVIGAGVVFYLVKKNVIKLGGITAPKKSNWDELRKKYNKRV